MVGSRRRRHVEERQAKRRRRQRERGEMVSRHAEPGRRQAHRGNAVESWARRHVEERQAQTWRKVHDGPQRKEHDEDREIRRDRTMRGRDWRWPLKRHKDPRNAVLWRKMEEESALALPFDLIVHQILVRLPLRKLRQLCCVCKSWNALLAWGGSVAPINFPQHEEEEYWFVMRSILPPVGVFTMYSSHERHLSLLPLRSARLLACLGGSKCSLLAIAKDCPWYQIIASAGGLMCALVLADIDGSLNVVVFNCLTGWVKVLPRPLRPKKLFFYSSPCPMYMAVDDQDPCRFYVMLTQSPLMGFKNLFYFEVFDSKTGSWRVGSHTTMKSSGLKVRSGDFFHYQCAYPKAPMQVLAYHVAKNAWSTVQAPVAAEPRNSKFHKYRGRFFQAHFLDEDDKNGLAFGVWELQFTSSETGTWVEVSRTPHSLDVPLERWGKIEAEGALFYTRGFDIEGDPAPVVYNISKNSWYVQPLPLERRNEFLLVHRPRLSMFFC